MEYDTLAWNQQVNALYVVVSTAAVLVKSRFLIKVTTGLCSHGTFLHQLCTSMYWYVLGCTMMYLYVQECTRLYPICTSIYLTEPCFTGFCGAWRDANMPDIEYLPTAEPSSENEGYNRL
jgi:hypothetical protein